MLKFLKDVDSDIAELVKSEKDRQVQTLSLIASESLAPVAIMEVLGSVYTNKTVEGFPKVRFHAGANYVDEVEKLAISRAKELFGAEYANVQPHSGTNANLAVYLAALKPHDTLVAMKLIDGGHLTHGHPINFSGQFYNFFHYGVSKETECIDYDEVEKLVTEHKPKMLVTGSSAYPRLIDWERLRSIADKVSAYLMVDMAHIAGLVAAKAIPSPVPYAHFVTGSMYKTMCGPRGGFILSRNEFGSVLDRAVFPGSQSAIIFNNVAAKAVAFKLAMTSEFQKMAVQIIKNARALAEGLQAEGFRIVSGGTDNHLMLVDLRNKSIKGKEAQVALENAGINTNMNLIPYDDEKPMVTSGLRLGTTSVTIQGMKEEQMRSISLMISRVLNNLGNDQVYAEIRSQVADLCSRFPIPGYNKLD